MFYFYRSLNSKSPSSKIQYPTNLFCSMFMIGITDFAKVFHWSLVRVTSSRFQAIDYVDIHPKNLQMDSNDAYTD